MRTQYDMSAPARLAVVTVIGVSVSLGILLATGSLQTHDLITPGELGPSADVIAEDFGAQVLDPGGTGYDGQQTYAIARYFPDLEAASPMTDRPRYRMLRILPPALASLAPPGSPTVVALLAINVLGLGLAVWASGRLMEHVGAPVWGAVPACSVLLVGVVTTTVGPIAWGLALVAMDLAGRRNWAPATITFIAAVLSRETTVVACLLTGAVLFLGSPERDRRVLLFGLPAVSILTWYLVLGQIVPGDVRTPMAPLAFTELTSREAVTPAIIAALGFVGAWAWRDRLHFAVVSFAFTGWMALYPPEVLHPLAIVRVGALPVILGVLGVIRMLARRTTTPRAVRRSQRHSVAERLG